MTEVQLVVGERGKVGVLLELFVIVQEGDKEAGLLGVFDDESDMCDVGVSVNEEVPVGNSDELRLKESVGFCVNVFVVGVGVGDGGEALGERLMVEVAEWVPTGVRVSDLVLVASAERVLLDVVVMEDDWECMGLPVGVVVCDGDAVGLPTRDNVSDGVGEVVKVGLYDGEGLPERVVEPVGVWRGDGDLDDEGVNAKLEVWDRELDGRVPDVEGVQVRVWLNVGLIE
mmetsp:Transcript_129901/g.224590  ORF Transcript_129901/g.224590 Transcript_129901/m.224590 type:complete len:228 (+) Transcript_129901:2927-3610(+)